MEGKDRLQDQELYRSYLLRLRRADRTGRWQLSLQSTLTRKEYHFSTLVELSTFLRAEIEEASDGEVPSPAIASEEKGDKGIT